MAMHACLSLYQSCFEVHINGTAQQQLFHDFEVKQHHYIFANYLQDLQIFRMELNSIHTHHVAISHVDPNKHYLNK